MKEPRYVITAIPMLVLAMLLAAGCGGASSQPVIPGTPEAPASSDSSGDQQQADQASITFKINWPSGHSGQIIPQETNRICLFVTATDILPPVQVVLNDVGKPETSVSLQIPEGTDRLVTAVARDVDYIPPEAPPVDLQPTRDDLLAGRMVASGRADAFDLAAGEHKTVTVTLAVPASLSPDDQYILPSGNQVDTGGFPYVVIYCTVVDQDGNPVLDLNIANFRVYEQPAGAPAATEAVVTDVRYVFESGSQEYGSVVLCLDHSGSMDGQPIADLIVAANFFVDLMHDQDQAEVVNFSTNVYVDQPFTTDKDLIRAAIPAWGASGMTSLYDATIRSIQDAASQEGRKAVIIMTDGKENDSVATLPEVAQVAATSDVPCYTIGLGPYVDTNMINLLADATGGVPYIAPTSDQLREIYGNIAVELATQIRITFISPFPEDHEPDLRRHATVFLTNYPPLTDGGDILAWETDYRR